MGFSIVSDVVRITWQTVDECVDMSLSLTGDIVPLTPSPGKPIRKENKEDSLDLIYEVCEDFG